MLQGMPKAAKLLEKPKENEIVTRFVFDISVGACPGQFVNLWIPGYDEKPFSVAGDDGKNLTLAIAAVGDMTKYMAEKLKVGMKVGVRGPYGKANRIPKNKKIATVGGGYGAAPLLFFAKEAIKNGCSVDFIIGARNKDLLLYSDEASKVKGVKVHVATDDGSCGVKGYCTQILEKLCSDGVVDFIATCGPELMENAVVNIARKYKVDADVSIERYMKCGIGVCGNCSNDGTGEPSCLSGPAMSLADIDKISDFGKYHRDSVGNKLYLGGKLSF